MIIKENKTLESLSLELLFDYWRLADLRVKRCAKAMKHFTVPEQYNKLMNWQLQLQMLSGEIERRADLLPIDFVLELIDKGHTFRFNR